MSITICHLFPLTNFKPAKQFPLNLNVRSQSFPKIRCCIENDPSSSCRKPLFLPLPKPDVNDSDRKKQSDPKVPSELRGTYLRIGNLDDFTFYSEPGSFVGVFPTVVQVAPPVYAAVPPSGFGAVPPSGFGAVPPPDYAAAPPPDDAAVPPPDDAAVPPPDDAAVPPPGDAAVLSPDDAAVPPPDCAAVPPPDDAAVPPPDDAAVPRPLFAAPPPLYAAAPPYGYAAAPPYGYAAAPPYGYAAAPPPGVAAVSPPAVTPPPGSAVAPPPGVAAVDVILLDRRVVNRTIMVMGTILLISISFYFFPVLKDVEKVFTAAKVLVELLLGLGKNGKP